MYSSHLQHCSGPACSDNGPIPSKQELGPELGLARTQPGRVCGDRNGNVATRAFRRSLFGLAALQPVGPDVRVRRELRIANCELRRSLESRICSIIGHCEGAGLGLHFELAINAINNAVHASQCDATHNTRSAGPTNSNCLLGLLGVTRPNLMRLAYSYSDVTTHTTHARFVHITNRVLYTHNAWAH